MEKIESSPIGKLCETMNRLKGKISSEEKPESWVHFYEVSSAKLQIQFRVVSKAV